MTIERLTDVKTRNGACRVVIVDKDPHLSDLVRHFLEEGGCETIFIEDGYEALDHIRAQPPTLVVTEILTPRLDGLALCRLIKRDRALRHTKVMILSVVSAEARARQSGADAFMMKPIEKQKLLAAVGALIGKQKQEQV